MKNRKLLLRKLSDDWYSRSVVNGYNDLIGEVDYVGFIHYECVNCCFGIVPICII